MSYDNAKEKYKNIGVEVDKVIGRVKEIPISIHAWQLDDVAGFETADAELSCQGIMTVGNYPGKAKNIDQFRADLEMVLRLVPGTKNIGLQSNEGDYKDRLKDKSDIDKSHFASWIDWAKDKNVGVDINPALYSHPLAESGYTISSKDKSVRDFWIGYVKKVREIADFTGSSLKKPSISNLWIIDGSKDITPSRYKHRLILKDSLDEIYSIRYSRDNIIDALECKLFGIGSEFYNVGSLDFYLPYAMKKNLGITLDTGHFHPTEQVSDKISSIVQFLPDIVLHLSRGIRWDSDHITILSDELIEIMQEIKRADCFDKVHLSTDYFDSSINRVGALVIGARAVAKALLFANLEPTDLIKETEDNEDNFKRLALLEDLKTMPRGEVWDHYCKVCNVVPDIEWIDIINRYFDKKVINR